MKKSAALLFAAALATAALPACGRNPGARTRAYPGTEKIQAALAAAQPKCISFDPKRIGGTAVVTGKDKFVNGRKGLFKLDSYQISQAIDRADRTVPSSTLRISEFDDLSSRAPRLAIEARCVDTKGERQSLIATPVTQIDSSTGLILESQPIKVGLSAEGRLSAETHVPTTATQALPAGRVPEAAILLGAQYLETFKTISFRAQESEDGSLQVKAEFIGMDPSLSRIFVRVEAVYGWDSAE